MNTPLPPLNPLLEAIGEPTRWRILRELAPGEPLMVKEIAERIGGTPTLVSKHIARLRKAGAVEVWRAGLYRIPAAFLANPAERLVDYGHLLLRFAAAPPAN